MVRVIHFRNYGVYVICERGVQHHRPHAHIKARRGRRVASIYLETLTLFNQVESVPRDLLDTITENQELLLSRWEELNDDA